MKALVICFRKWGWTYAQTASVRYWSGHGPELQVHRCKYHQQFVMVHLHQCCSQETHKCLYFLRMLSKFGMSQITNSTDAHEKASYPNTSQLGMATALPRSIRNCRELWMQTRPSHSPASSPLTSCCLRKPDNIIEDHSNPRHSHFSLLLSSLRSKSFKALITRFKNNFFSIVIRFLYARDNFWSSNPTCGRPSGFY